MNFPLVSIIIPNYNYGHLIREAIDSVLSQTYPNIEIIVVDDGSSDNSIEVLEDYGNNIRWVSQENKGVSQARNAGAKICNGEYLAFLDSDDVWLPEKIHKQIEVFSSDTEIGLVHCGVVDIDSSGNQLEKHIDGMSGKVAEDLLRYERKVILGGGSAIVVSRLAFESVGGFDKNLRIGEDWEFNYRVASISKVGFIPEILVKYRIHSRNSFANNPDIVRRMEKDILNAYDKIFSGDSKLKPIRNVCYGKIHSVIAGSYLRSGEYKQFLRHSVKSLWLSPKAIPHYLSFPKRWLQRQIHALKSSKIKNT